MANNGQRLGSKNESIDYNFRIGIVFVIAVIVVILGYFLHRGGYFNKIFRSNTDINGLENKGQNICYMNSIIQCLYSLDEFKKLIAENNSDENRCKCTKYLHSIFQKMDANISNYNPKDFLKCINEGTTNINFEINKEADSHEFLLFLIEVLRIEYLEQNPKVIIEDDVTMREIVQPVEKNNLNANNYMLFSRCHFSQMFDAIVEKKSVCSGCKYEISKTEIEMATSYAIDKSVQGSINKYCNETYMHDCENCAVSTNVKIERNFMGHPKIFIMCFQRKANEAERISTPVNIQKEIQLGHKNYELKGFVAHSGCPMSGGHYTNISQRNNSWYEFNDLYVHKLSEKKLKDKLNDNKDVYILFYERKPDE